MFSIPLVHLLALLTGCAPYSDLAVEGQYADVSYALEAAPGRTRLRGYDGHNDPALMLDNPELRWDRLPKSGRLMKQPWSGSYWPKYKGGIAYRWQTGESHDYDLLSADEVQSASEAQLRRLSPAEKYDIYVGNTDYPLTEHVKSATRPTEPHWTGYCHGWTIASSHYEEPQPVTMLAPSGQKIRFGSSDVKALLTFFKGEVIRSTWAEHEWSPETKGIGTVCGSGHPGAESCTDSNPGAFHVVITNRIGLEQRDVFMDVEPTYEKWNQPIFGYRTRLIDERQTPDRGPSAVRELFIETEIDYALEIEPTWEAVGGTRESASKTITYTYTVQLDTMGQITGGEWVLPLEDGSFISIQEAWAHLITVDENGDGRPDNTEDEATAIIWTHFKFPDYLWIQDGGDFSDSFRQPFSSYEFMSMTRSSRQHFYDYFAPLAEIYDASIGR